MAHALDDLLDALEDVDDATREEAAKSLAEIADATTLDALIGACGDEYWSVRAHAGAGVARIGGPKALEALVGLFNDAIMEVRNQAVDAASKMGAAALDRMIAALKDERLAQLAAKYGVSIAQLCIRYCLELGLLPLPKTSNVEHMRANAALEFEISQEDMAMLRQAEGQDYGEASAFPVFGKPRKVEG